MKLKPLLIAEDEENDVFFIKRAIQKVGIPNPVTVVASGQQVVDYLSGVAPYADRSRHPLPALLILDLKMPCLSGIEVLDWLRQQPGSLRRLPVVVLSSSSLTSDVEQAYSSGANAYAVKPPDPDSLTQLIRDLGNWWLKQNVSPL